MKEDNVQAIAKHLQPLPDPPKELETLFREHYDQVFRTAYRITGNAGDAEDVLQTVFLRLTSRPENRDLSPSPGSYLHRAAINASLDVIRSRNRAGAVSIEEIDFNTLESAALSPEALQADREVRELIQQAVAQLGDRAAEIFVLRYFEGYGNAEIAQMLGTSQLVVGVLLHRARGRVRKELSHYLERNHETNS